MRGPLVVIALTLLVAGRSAEADRGPLVQPFVSVDAPIVVLMHARVIDGTGAAPRDNQTLVVRDGRIASVGGGKIALPAGARILDLAGKTVLPGLVGMHEHLFYPPKMVLGAAVFDESFFVPQPFSFPRLYLAAGVTTARTAGSVSPYTDLAVKRLIESGRAPGPRLDVTGPYIEGAEAADRAVRAASRRRRGHAPRRLLGRRGRHLVQGLQLRLARAARRRHRRRASPRAQGRRPSLLGRFSRRGRRRHRQPRARDAWSTPSSSTARRPTNARRKRSSASTASTSPARRCRRSSAIWSRTTSPSPRRWRCSRAFTGAADRSAHAADAGRRSAQERRGRRTRSCRAARRCSTPLFKKEQAFERAFVKAGGLLPERLRSHRRRLGAGGLR